MRTDPIIIRREQIGQWASYIGGTGLVTGIIGLLWQGGATPLILAMLAIGAAGIALWALMSPDDFKGFITGRKTRYSTTAVFATLLLVGIVGITYVILQRSVLTLDMTDGGRFSISQETKVVLRRISRPIRITGFYSPQGIQLREIDDQFFRLYEVETDGLISRNYIDPEEQPAVAQLYNVITDGSVYISFLNEDGSVDFSTVQRVPRGTSQERDMTEAIARLLISGTLKVYFETSHGERDPLDGTQQGLSRINLGIQESGLITAPLSIAELVQSGGQIPDDASAVILARPTTDFSTAEIAVVDNYLKRGGALFIMADALFNADAFLRQEGEFNAYLWNNYGLRMLDAVVVDAASSEQTPLDIISAAVFPDNEIASRLDSENAPTLFSVARAIEVSETPPQNTPNGRIILSSEQSYGETNLQALGETNTFNFDAGQDIPGPLTTVAWAYNNRTGGKILLVGDSDFVTNSLVLTGGNSILFTDGLSWLTGFGERINFAPQAYSTGLPLIFVSGQILDVIAFLTIILLPGVVLVMGLIVWSRRARQ